MALASNQVSNGFKRLTAPNSKRAGAPPVAIMAKRAKI